MQKDGVTKATSENAYEMKHLIATTYILENFMVEAI